MTQELSDWMSFLPYNQPVGLKIHVLAVCLLSNNCPALPSTGLPKRSLYIITYLQLLARQFPSIERQQGGANLRRDISSEPWHKQHGKGCLPDIRQVDRQLLDTSVWVLNTGIW